jgi:FAD:protein FMN transferase
MYDLEEEMPAQSSRLRLSLKLFIGLMLASFGTVAAAAPVRGAVVERRLLAMGTSLELTVRAGSRSEALTASEAAVREVARVEALLTTWRGGGELDCVNHWRAGVPVSISPELYRLLRQVLGWQQRTRGAFDPAIGPLVKAWGLRGGGRIPAKAELDRAREASRPGAFRLSGRCCRLTRSADASLFEEGAWGKGYALDRARQVLEGMGIDGALVDLGGQLLALGRPPEGQKGSAGIADPRERARPVVRVRFDTGSLSTSGDSERSLEVSGQQVGHLLDPRTGRPAADFGSATVWSPSALAADVLSTAMFVLGPEEGMNLSEHLARAGIRNEVLFLVVGRSGLSVRASADFGSRIEWFDPRRVVRP